MAILIKPVSTSLRHDEVAEIDRVLPGYTRAQNLRVLIRYALHHKSDVQAFLATTSSEPFDN